jgi:hypothetical protein
MVTEAFRPKNLLRRATTEVKAVLRGGKIHQEPHALTPLGETFAKPVIDAPRARESARTGR